MAPDKGDVEFEIVDTSDPSPVSKPASAKAHPERSPETQGPSQGKRNLDRDRFPLAGPIFESARGRELKGCCSNCEARLRIRVEGEGSRRVRCPICGHARRIEV